MVNTTYWHKQTDKPLFPELEWNKPERRDQAGRLLIIGGNLHNLTAPAKAYEVTKQTGIGAVQMILPDKTKRLVGSTLPGAVFVPSTASGELAQAAESLISEQLHWADTLLLPGDLGRNSQTTILLEAILSTGNQPAVLTRDAIDSLSRQPLTLLNRVDISLILSFAQLQKLLAQAGETSALTYSINLVQLVERLRDVSQRYQASLATYHYDQLIVAASGKVSTTKTNFVEDHHWRTTFASFASCYLTWNPTQPFESLTEAAYQTSIT